MLLTKQLNTYYPRVQTADNSTYLLQLIPAQIWHVNGALTNQKCDQDTLRSKLLSRGNVEAYREDSHVPIAKDFHIFCEVTNVAAAA